MNEAAKSRVWQFTLHEDARFNDRTNCFLLVHALLTVSYSLAIERSQRSVPLIIATAGILLAAAWLAANNRHLRVMRVVQAEAMRALDEYADLQQKRPAARVRVRHVVGYAVPALLLSLWVTLLAIAI